MWHAFQRLIIFAVIAANMLASLTPCLLHRSATDTPASCPFKIPMICSSEKRLC